MEKAVSPRTTWWRTVRDRRPRRLARLFRRTRHHLARSIAVSAMAPHRCRWPAAGAPRSGPVQPPGGQRQHLALAQLGLGREGVEPCQFVGIEPQPPGHARHLFAAPRHHDLIAGIADDAAFIWPRAVGVA
jgi:hypothetical protein